MPGSAAAKLLQQLVDSLDQSDALQAESVAAILQQYDIVHDGHRLGAVWRLACQTPDFPSLRNLVRAELNNHIDANDWRAVQQMLKGGARLSRDQLQAAKAARAAALRQRQWPDFLRLGRLIAAFRPLAD